MVNSHHLFFSSVVGFVIGALLVTSLTKCESTIYMHCADASSKAAFYAEWAKINCKGDKNKEKGACE